MGAKRLRIVGVLACWLAAGACAGAGRDLRMIEAAKRDDISAVKTLAAAGVDVNARASDGSTALHWAAQNDDPVLADALIRKGAKVDATTDLGVSALWVAATNSSTATIARLLSAHANPNIVPPTGRTPLMIASRVGNVDAVRALLAHGADPNAKELAHGQSALMWAVAERHPEVVRLLLLAHADVQARSSTWMQRQNICCQLTGGDEDPVVVPQGGFTPLLFAAQYGDAESAKLLIAAGADLKAAASDGTGALVIAAHVGQTGVAEVLLQAGADANAAGAGYSALHVAAAAGDLAMAKALLDHGANPNVRQEKGSPTKRVASGHSMDRRMVGATPFVLAAHAGHLEVMKLLIAKGADPSIPLKDGRSAVMVLASHGTVEGPRSPDPQAAEAIKLAVKLGTPVDQADLNGNTALHTAATLRRDVVVQALVDSGAGLEVRNHAGETPLAAALKPPPPRAGSDVVDEYGFLLNHTQTAELLRKLGAKS